jgi:hypothetical protein
MTPIPFGNRQRRAHSRTFHNAVPILFICRQVRHKVLPLFFAVSNFHFEYWSHLHFFLQVIDTERSNLIKRISIHPMMTHFVRVFEEFRFNMPGLEVVTVKDVHSVHALLERLGEAMTKCFGSEKVRCFGSEEVQVAFDKLIR